MHHFQSIENFALLQSRLASIPVQDIRDIFVAASVQEVAGFVGDVIARQTIPKPVSRNAEVERLVTERLVAASGDAAIFEQAVQACRASACTETELILNAARGFKLFVNEMCAAIDESVGRSDAKLAEAMVALRNTEARLMLADAALPKVPEHIPSSRFSVP